MKRITQWIRLWQIQRAILRHNLLEIVVPPNAWFHFIVPLSKLNFWYWRRDKNLTRGERLRLCLQELGPFFIKFGQLLSTRRDILPDDLANELAKLQDRVAPFTTPDVTTVVSAALGRPLTEVLIDFNPIPLASASIAQVHEAHLLDGSKIVVKVLRPNIEKIIARDLYLLKNLARHSARFLAQGARLMAIVNEIEQTIYGELDLLREAASMSQLSRAQVTVPYLHTPKVIWPLTRSNLLVMERIHGIPFTDMAAIRASGVDMKLLAENLIRLFFTQVFDLSFFHADLHAGNLFLDQELKRSPHIIMVDFGIVGILNATDLSYLAENLYAFLKSDYQRVAELHVESGWVPADTRIEQFACAISTVCEPLLAQPLKDISFGTVMLRLLQTAAQFNAQVQPQLILLQKTLISVEGLSRQIYADVDFFNIAHEIVETWIKQRSGMRGFFRALRKHAPQFASQIPNLPELIYSNLQTSLKINKAMLACKPHIQVPATKHHFWSGVGITSLVFGVALSIFLSTGTPIGHLSLLVSSIGLGVFGICSLLISKLSSKS